MTSPESAQELREAAEQERQDEFAGLHRDAPDPLGAEIAQRLHDNPEFQTWSKDHIYFTDSDGRRLTLEEFDARLAAAEENTDV